MAKDTITGYKVGLYVEKEDGSGTYVRVLCANSITLDITTEALPTDCQDDPDADGNFAVSEPGQISWTAGTEMSVRNFSGADVDKNVAASDLVDYQLAGRKLKIQYQLGKIAGSPIYSGLVWINKNGFSGANKDTVKAAVGFTGTGPLTKSVVVI
jgi:hypothetical protein